MNVLKSYMLVCAMTLSSSCAAQTDRNFWDVRHYDIQVEPVAESQTLWVKTKVDFVFTEKPSVKKPLVFDLKNGMQIQNIRFSETNWKWERSGDQIIVIPQKEVKKNKPYWVEFEYRGQPQIAKNAPWDGGWVFKKDYLGKDFIGVAQEGAGASLWIASKDDWADEPDQGIHLHIITSPDLVGVGNGRLTNSTKLPDGKIKWSWTVTQPINLYSISPTIGDFTYFSDQYHGKGGTLDLHYYVLKPNLEKAKNQFRQVSGMMDAFEYWFGKYPFYKDSYKLVETPYLGMEHQSNIAYGNGYKNGYKGRDLSGTGIGLWFDFIIIHETGHEWFANSITARNHEHMWIHEAFTTYSEVLYTEYHFGKENAKKYVIGIRRNIENDSPMLGKNGDAGSGDMYYKGANMIHTLRQIINDDELFRKLLLELNIKYYHKIIDTQELIQFVNIITGKDFTGFFNLYLQHAEIPILEYFVSKDTLSYRFPKAENNLYFPVKLKNGIIIQPQNVWQSIPWNPENKPEIDDEYLIRAIQISEPK